MEFGALRAQKAYAEWQGCTFIGLCMSALVIGLHWHVGKPGSEPSPGRAMPLHCVCVSHWAAVGKLASWFGALTCWQNRCSRPSKQSSRDLKWASHTALAKRIAVHMCPHVKVRRCESPLKP